jgi:succinate dehydrogenase/fumarate reductase cytochrome b subunit
MAARSWNYYLVKTARISGWLLFLLVLLYIVTGFSLCGELGFGRIIDEQSALSIHKVFEWPLVGTFVTHSVVTIYFAFRRWGWIKTRVPPSRSKT